jgi:hypothetical protein
MSRRFNKNKLTDIESLKDDQYPLVYTTWNGNPALVKCRLLTSAQLQACGDFSLIQTERDKINADKKLTPKELIEYASTMHNIVEAALVSPTYEQLMNMVQANDLWKKAKKELDELQELCKGIRINDYRRKKAEDEINKKRIWVDIILPEDFMAYIFCYVIDLSRSDIKKVTEEMLLNAAILAEKWSKAPSDYISGMFTEHNKMDIDRRALIELHNRREAEKGQKAS